ncbi:MinD/ParA family protein [Halobacillus sp. A1]|uniref:MinD/ParA family protein n=1 Tax=Halobacillus sp. A1 TaxID=2880262 RepID=UPI0020A647C7|nr:MinD/ParA family protein [Halobacillus sp. A1]MCP3031213.1 MinD/ParA family protein [Halobacillus sp. A1]
MNDQAASLRRRLKHQTVKAEAKTIAVASGKGGVGKSTLTINFALKLIKQGNNVLIIDLDIGMGNIDILLGVTPKYSFTDLFESHMTIFDIIERGPLSVSYIAGGSGLASIFSMGDEKFSYFQSEYQQLAKAFDYILFDMGAGVTPDSLKHMIAAEEVILVTTPEPTSLTDAYSLLKHLVREDPDVEVQVLTNRAMNEQSAIHTYERLENAANKFLGKKINLLGAIPEDRHVFDSVLKQVPFTLESPKCKASKSMDELVNQYLKIPSRKNESFLEKLRRLVQER